MLHPTIALKGMATLILNLVSDTSLVLLYEWLIVFASQTVVAIVTLAV